MTAAAPTPVARAWRAFTAGPDYPPDAGDLADVRLFGLALPVRASIALAVVTVVMLAEWNGALRFRGLPLPFADGADPASLGGAAVATFGRSMGRFVLFGLVPLAVVVALFGDDPRRYGLRLGAWRWGLGLAAAGVAVMVPVIVVLASQPAFADYYLPFRAPLASLVATHALDLLPAEFLLRGFLFFALLRRIGPLAIVVVQVPFAFAHLGKPELELYSTLFGGACFAWLDWRTGSILWSGLAHVAILTLMVVAAAGGVGPLV